MSILDDELVMTFMPSLVKIRVGQKRHSPCKNAERLEKNHVDLKERAGLSVTYESSGHGLIALMKTRATLKSSLAGATAKTVNGPRRLPPVGVDN